jgi:hypothetical protein
MHSSSPIRSSNLVVGPRRPSGLARPISRVANTWVANITTSYFFFFWVRTTESRFYYVVFDSKRKGNVSKTARFVTSEYLPAF